MWVYLLLVSWRSKEKYTLFSFLPKREFTQKKLRYHGLPLQDNAFIAGTAGDPFAIEVFKQGDGVLAGDSCHLLKGWHGDAAAFVFLKQHQLIAKLGQSIAMKNQLRCDTDKI